MSAGIIGTGAIAHRFAIVIGGIGGAQGGM
jgi:hypothetical protein